MEDDWEKTQQVGLPAKFDDEVTDSWDTAYDETGAEKDAQSSQPASSVKKDEDKKKEDTSAGKGKAKGVKVAAGSKGKDPGSTNEAPEREKTREEVEREQEEAERDIARDLCDSSISIDTFKPTNEKQFDQLATAIVDRCRRFNTSEHFVKLVDQIINQLASSLEMKDLRKVKDSIGSLYESKQKQEKKKAKSLKGVPKLNTGNMAADRGVGARKASGAKGFAHQILEDMDDFLGPSKGPVKRGVAAQHDDEEEEGESENEERRAPTSTESKDAPAAASAAEGDAHTLSQAPSEANPSRRTIEDDEALF